MDLCGLCWKYRDQGNRQDKDVLNPIGNEIPGRKHAIGAAMIRRIVLTSGCLRTSSMTESSK